MIMISTVNENENNSIPMTLVASQTYIGIIQDSRFTNHLHRHYTGQFKNGIQQRTMKKPVQMFIIWFS